MLELWGILIFKKPKHKLSGKQTKKKQLERLEEMLLVAIEQCSSVCGLETTRDPKTSQSTQRVKLFS